MAACVRVCSSSRCTPASDIWRASRSCGRYNGAVWPNPDHSSCLVHQVLSVRRSLPGDSSPLTGVVFVGGALRGGCHALAAAGSTPAGASCPEPRQASRSRSRRAPRCATRNLPSMGSAIRLSCARGRLDVGGSANLRSNSRTSISGVTSTVVRVRLCSARGLWA